MQMQKTTDLQAQVPLRRIYQFYPLMLPAGALPSVASGSPKMEFTFLISPNRKRPARILIIIIPCSWCLKAQRKKERLNI